jgi:hypothetical protein
MAEQAVAFWQGNLLADTRTTLAEIRFMGTLGWTVQFPDSGGLVNGENEDEVMAGSERLDSYAAARTFGSAVARSQGYRIVSRKAGIEAFAKANTHLAQPDGDDGAGPSGPKP